MKFTIKASVPKDNDKKWRFTPLDKACLGMVIRGTWLFKTKPDHEILKESLGQLLNYYPHLSGRMNSENYIELNNEGVDFLIKEEKSINVKDIEKIKNPIRYFAAGLKLSDVKKGTSAPLSIRLTYIADGSVLSVHCAHVCMDGNSFYTMIDNWGRIARNETIIVPLLNQSLFPATEDMPKEKAMQIMNKNNWKAVGIGTLFKQLFSEIKGISKQKSDPIHISAEMISELKRSVVEKSGVEYSTHVLLSAFITKVCLYLSDIENSIPCSQISVVDARGRIKSLPRNFTGNAVSNIAASGFTSGSHIAIIAEKISSSLQNIFANEGRHLEEFIKLNLYAMMNKLPLVPFDVENMNSKNPSVIYINNLRKFPIYELDFGFGRPNLVIPHDLPDSVRLWPCKPGKDGVDIYFAGYLAKKYNKLKNKEEWLKKLFNKFTKTDLN